MLSKVSILKKIELVFDSIYLSSTIILGGCLILKATSNTMLLWGIMALVLVFGDAFHLLPRMAAAYTGKTKRFKKAMGIGKLITSLTMTVFYILLWHSALAIFSIALPLQTLVLYMLAGIRIIICLLPQNKWKEGAEGTKMGFYRNLPFLLQGMFVLWIYLNNATQMPAVRFVWIAIAISFLCYIPVVLWVPQKPKLGMLMLPKTCAYLWIVGIGFFI